MKTRQEYVEKFNAIWESYMQEFSRHVDGHEQLRSCKAVVHYIASGCVLQSYNTIVAIADYQNDVLLVRGYYSATTAQHIAKFQHDFCPDSYTVLRGEPNSKNVIAYSVGRYGFHGEWKVSSKGNLYFRNNDGYKFYDNADGLNACMDNLARF